MVFQVTNASKASPPARHPEYNGTQGPAGPPGSPGPGNLTLCSYQTGSSPGQARDTYARQIVERTESNVGLKVTTVMSGFFTIERMKLCNMLTKFFRLLTSPTILYVAG